MIPLVKDHIVHIIMNQLACKFASPNSCQDYPHSIGFRGTQATEDCSNTRN